MEMVDNLLGAEQVLRPNALLEPAHWHVSTELSPSSRSSLSAREYNLIQGLTSTSQPLPQEDVLSRTAVQQPMHTDEYTAEAREALREYIAFYQHSVDGYVQMLQVEGTTLDGNLRYARERGLPRLQALLGQVEVDTAEQAMRLTGLLTGYRQIAASTRGIDGRGTLLIRLVEDLMRRLVRLDAVRVQQPVSAVTVTPPLSDLQTGALAA